VDHAAGALEFGVSQCRTFPPVNNGDAGQARRWRCNDLEIDEWHEQGFHAFHDAERHARGIAAQSADHPINDPMLKPGTALSGGIHYG